MHLMYPAYPKNMEDDNLFDDVEAHLEEVQFRNKVMLFQRCDNVLRELLTNLDEITPSKQEEKRLYRGFIDAARILVMQMEPFWPEKTFTMMQAKLEVYEERLRGERP